MTVCTPRNFLLRPSQTLNINTAAVILSVEWLIKAAMCRGDDGVPEIVTRTAPEALREPKLDDHCVHQTINCGDQGDKEGE